jgi:hypothetical protein
LQTAIQKLWHEQVVRAIVPKPKPALWQGPAPPEHLAESDRQLEGGGEPWVLQLHHLWGGAAGRQLRPEPLDGLGSVIQGYTAGKEFAHSQINQWRLAATVLAGGGCCVCVVQSRQVSARGERVRVRVVAAWAQTYPAGRVHDQRRPNGSKNGCAVVQRQLIAWEPPGLPGKALGL